MIEVAWQAKPQEVMKVLARSQWDLTCFSFIDSPGPNACNLDAFFCSRSAVEGFCCLRERCLPPRLCCAVLELDTGWSAIMVIKCTRCPSKNALYKPFQIIVASMNPFCNIKYLQFAHKLSWINPHVLFLACLVISSSHLGQTSNFHGSSFDFHKQNKLCMTGCDWLAKWLVLRYKTAMKGANK